MLVDVTGLVEKIKKAAQEANEAAKPVNVCFGEVVNKSPLKINVEQKMVLGEKQLVLTRNVTDYMTTVTVQWETAEENIRHKHAGGGSGDTEYAEVAHAHDVVGTKNFLIHNALEVGDEVVLIRQQEGQKYIVLDRIGGVR